MSKLYTLLLAGVFLFSSAADAQPSDSPADTLQLDQVVVTASKFEQTQRETTKPAIIIDRRDIERSGSKDLPRLLNSQSGIRVNNSYATPSENSGLFMQGAAASYTLILVNGLAINDPSGTGGTFDLRLIPLSNIERIEIIKGSQSTLYGTDAVAGVVNIITKRGSDDPFTTQGSLSYGSYNTLNGSLGVRGSAADWISYNVNYSVESSDGFSAAEDPSGEDEFDPDGFTRNAIFARVDLQPTSNLTISPFINYSDYQGEFDADAFVDADNVFGLEMINPGLQFQFEQDQFTLNGGYNLIKTDRFFESEFGVNEFEGTLHNLDVYSTYQLGENLKFLGGLNYQDNEMPGMDNGENLEAEVLSPYTTLYLQDWNGLSAEFGLRVNNHTEYGNNTVFNVAPSFNITENTKLYASFGTGFKTPTLSELFGPFGANPELQPEESQYFNAGVETYLLDQRLKLGAQYFDRQIDNIIVFTSAEGFVNRDRQDDYGVELTAEWIVNADVSVGGFYNYLAGELTTTDEQGNTVTDGDLIRRPAHNLGGTVTYSPIDRVTVKLEGEFNSERFDQFFNPANNFEPEQVTLDAYTLFNVYGEYQLRNYPVTFFGDIINLFNTEFTEVYGFNTTGFAATGGFRFRF